MNIEESVELLKGFNPGDEKTEQYKKAIDNVLTAYEKEKVSRKVMQDNWSQNVKLAEELKAELEKEKEKNSKLLEALDTVNHEKGVFIESYEKEKEENIKLRLQNIPLIEKELKAYKDRVNELKIELEKEKEKNKIAKEFIKENSHEFNCKRDDLIELEFDNNTNASDLIDILDGNL